LDHSLQAVRHANLHPQDRLRRLKQSPSFAWRAVAFMLEVPLYVFNQEAFCQATCARQVPAVSQPLRLRPAFRSLPQVALKLLSKSLNQAAREAHWSAGPRFSMASSKASRGSLEKSGLVSLHCTKTCQWLHVCSICKNFRYP
jgi:hypothetical protein